jgi:DNA-directed RNA polymerase specialized sigma24 family protein
LPDPACREILLLRFEGFTNEQIAEQLGVSLATVERKRRLTRTLLEDMTPDLGDEIHE